MKTKLSISVEKDVARKAEVLIRDGRFRNKSHLIEYALRSFIKNNKDNHQGNQNGT